MRVHPLRTKGVIVGVPVAAAVAFGAHTVLGITPVSDQQHDTQTASSAPGVAQSGAPVQSYGLATAPPPTTLGLLSAPAVEHGSSPHDAATPTGSSSGPHLTAGPARSVPIAAPPAAPSSMLTFSPAAAPAAAAPAAAVPAAVAPAAAPAARAQAAPQAVQHTEAPAASTDATPDSGGSSSSESSGGSLLGLDLGVAKVSVLSFGD
jgi:hypothetical protein